jgi:predicted small lipoprotein YifL
MSRPLLILAMMVTALLLCGCGLKGDLYLPDQSTTPVVTSASAASASSSSSSPP